MGLKAYSQILTKMSASIIAKRNNDRSGNETALPHPKRSII